MPPPPPPDHNHGGAATPSSSSSSSASSSASSTSNNNNPNPANQTTTTKNAGAVADPDPFPLAADPYEPTAAEDLIMMAWFERNPSYWTSIAWHRYATPCVLSPLWGYTTSAHRAVIFNRLCSFSRVARRRLTDLERDAVLEAMCRHEVAMSYERPVAIGLSAWLVGRSWVNSGLREAAREATAAAAAAAAAGGGGGGHVTYFSSPTTTTPFSSAPTVNPVFGSLFRRIARTSFVGLSCYVAWRTLQPKFEDMIDQNTIAALHSDWRLVRPCVPS